MSTGAIVGIVIGGIALVLIIVGGVCFYMKKKRAVGNGELGQKLRSNGY